MDNYNENSNIDSNTYSQFSGIPSKKKHNIGKIILAVLLVFITFGILVGAIAFRQYIKMQDYAIQSLKETVKNIDNSDMIVFFSTGNQAEPDNIVFSDIFATTCGVCKKDGEGILLDIKNDFVDIYICGGDSRELYRYYYKTDKFTQEKVDSDFNMYEDFGIKSEVHKYDNLEPDHAIWDRHEDNGVLVYNMTEFYADLVSCASDNYFNKVTYTKEDTNSESEAETVIVWGNKANDSEYMRNYVMCYLLESPYFENNADVKEKVKNTLYSLGLTDEIVDQYKDEIQELAEE